MEFVIVKVKRGTVRNKIKNTKYGRLLQTMEKLKVGEHIVVFPNTPEGKVNQNLHNMVKSLKQFKDLLPRRKFELSTLRKENDAQDVIVKRVE